MIWLMVGFIVWCMAVVMVLLKPEVFIRDKKGR